jgi:bacteriocin-like protein
MSIEEIIQSWKACEECEEAASSTNPVGEELSNQELEEVTGGMSCTFSMFCLWTDLTDF